MTKLTRHLGWALSILGIAVGTAGRARADLTIPVTPSNMDGWAAVVTDGNGTPTPVGFNPTGSVTFVTGPATPPLGLGNANLQTGNGAIGGDGSAQLRNSDYAGIRLDSITALMYSTYVTSNNGQQFPYLSLAVATSGTGAANDQLYFEPPYQTPSTGNPSLPDQGASVLNTWQTWNALAGGWWSDSGVGTPGTADPNALPPVPGVVPLSTYLAMYPDATLVNAGDLGGVSLKVGYASSTDKFNGYVDNFKIGVAGVTTTYDFEPNSVEVAAVPEPATLTTAVAGVLILVGCAYRRRRREVA